MVPILARIDNKFNSTEKIETLPNSSGMINHDMTGTVKNEMIADPHVPIENPIYFLNNFSLVMVSPPCGEKILR